jgi:hyperosmotically inducible periplasmic protein
MARDLHHPSAMSVRTIALHGRTLGIACIVGLAGFAGLVGCGRPQDVAEAPADEHAPHVERGAQGTEIEYHHEEAARHLDQAGRDLGQGAKELGQALAHGAQEVGKEVAPVARDAGRQLAEGAKQVGQEVGEKAGPALSDAGLTAKVKANLVSDSGLSGFQIGVETTAGEVTLTGKVPTPEQKAAAERIAIQTGGVRRVINRIEIGG